MKNYIHNLDKKVRIFLQIFCVLGIIGLYVLLGEISFNMMNYVEIRTNETNQNKYFNNSMDNNITFIKTLLDSDLKKLTNVTTQNLKEYKNFLKEKTPLLKSQFISETQKEGIKQSIDIKRWDYITNILKFFQSNGYGDLSKDMNGFLYKNFDNLSLMEPKSAESQINKFLSKKFTYHFNIKQANQYRLKITDGTKRVLKYNETFRSRVLSKNELKSAVDTANDKISPKQKEEEKKNVEKNFEEDIKGKHKSLINKVNKSTFNSEEDVKNFINNQERPIKRYLEAAKDQIIKDINFNDNEKQNANNETIKNNLRAEIDKFYGYDREKGTYNYKKQQELAAAKKGGLNTGIIAEESSLSQKNKDKNQDETNSDINTDENGLDDTEMTQEKIIETTLNNIENIDYSSIWDLNQKIHGIFEDNGIDIGDTDTKTEVYINYSPTIERFGEDLLGKESGYQIAMTYAIACGINDINTEDDLREFIRTVQSAADGNAVRGKYAEQYKRFLDDMGQYYEELIEEIAIQSLIERYYAANAVAEGRNFYESDFINFAISTAEGQTQTGLQVASNIDNIDSKLNHYGFKANRSEHEEAALKYTAFDITFKNTFNLNNPIIEKLAAQQVDLRDDLFKYGIYISENNYFNKEARDRYISEKLQHLGLAPEEIDELGNAIAGLPLEVENNYKILSGNFDADQNNFEKITKIFALGEVIDHIKNLFTNGEILSDNVKLGTVMGFELDENEPADIVGDYLFLKGKVNGTETKIKYDLRTGKLYMNSFTQQELHPPKITIGNEEPNTEIGDIGNFDDLLDGYQPTSFKQNEGIDYTQTSNDNMIYDEKSDEQKPVESDSQDKNQKTLEELMENKLLEKLAIIGETVKKKTGEQSKENNIIDEFLKTFNILPDTGEPKDIEFMGGSELYILLDSIKNTNDEDYLLKFSKLMSELMTFCGFTRGKNNLLPKDSGFDSITIFDIDEKDATTDIISLKRANKSFFSEGDSEKDKVKSCEQHFDSSVKLSFADIIVQKCCRRFGDGWQISINHAQDFVTSIKKGIENIKHDENDVVAMENMIEDESLWT